MFKMLRTYLLLVVTAGLLLACGDSETPQEKVTAASEEKAVQLPAEVIETPVAESVSEVIEDTTSPDTEVTNEVVTEVEETVAEIVEQVQEEAEVIVESASTDKPYQLVDGAISANAIEGWKTYNGGGCGACHGKGGIGAVGPNLAQSVKTKLSKEEFVNIVTNGKSGTMMRPHKTNTRVMDNMDNLYAYLVARGDDVLGPGNLIKLPLGK
jgi:mono/diheme cytochrome c family protein